MVISSLLAEGKCFLTFWFTAFKSDFIVTQQKRMVWKISVKASGEYLQRSLHVRFSVLNILTEKYINLKSQTWF